MPCLLIWLYSRKPPTPALLNDWRTIPDFLTGLPKERTRLRTSVAPKSTITNGIIRRGQHSFLEIVPAGSEARIFVCISVPGFSKWSERQRGREIRNLLKGIERHQHGFHVLVGDFNTLAPGEILDVRKMPGWIRALVWISGRDIQRETIQVMLDAGYADGFRLLHPDIKGYTFPTWDRHLRLDYVFVPANSADRLKACEVVEHPPEVFDASDHLPLLAQLEIPMV